MPCAVPVPVLGSTKLLSTVSPRPIPVGGRSQQGQESAWRGHIALYPHTNSVNLTYLSDPPCSLLPILAPGVLSFQGRCLTIRQTSTNAPFMKWRLFSHEFSKVHSAKLGHERALGGKSDHLSPVDVPKAGFCPWDPLQMITTVLCPKMMILCSSDSQCSGNMKCCNVDCTMRCTPPVPSMQLQDPALKANPGESTWCLRH